MRQITSVFHVRQVLLISELPMCRVPCDHVPRKSWAFFEARAVMLGVLESFERE